MSSTKEIRSKIGSVKNTQKITRAMEMVAASKMRKTQDQMFTSRPYSSKIRQVISHVANSHPEYKHAFFDVREQKRVGLIIVSSDRGLCGGLNANLLRKAIADMKQWQEKDVAIDLCTIGNKALHFFGRFGGNLIAHAEHLGNAPSAQDIVGIVKIMLDAYENKQLDYLALYYNRFINTMAQTPETVQLLPLEAEASDEKKQTHWDYIYEPDARELLSELLKRYIETQVYQAVIENLASEQAARMVAMKSATDNAGKIIDDLQLIYNKVRQASITQEIAEIVGGADAIL